MEENEIIQAINVYMEESETDYAIMINGKWGVGKTFFVKNTLMRNIQDQFSVPVIYNSLFGLDTIDELWETIGLQIADIKMNDKGRKQYYYQTKHKLPLKLLDNNKGANLTAHIFKGLLGIIPKGNQLNDILSTILKSSVNFSNQVYIFDDLERLSKSIDMKSILGVIDLLANQCGAKVIVVCNESYFYTKQSQNKEQKNEKNSENTVNAFIKNEHKEYEEFKEKIIGITIDYKPNIEYVINCLIEK